MGESALSYEEELALLQSAVEKFRKRWKKKVAAVATRIKLFKPKRGPTRYAYLLDDGSPIFDGLARAWRIVNLQVEEFTDRYGTNASRTIWMPTIERKCRAATLSVYGAMSIRSVDEDVARRFLLRIEKDVREGHWRYVIRSETGRKYKLRIRQDGRWKYSAVSEWIVLGCAVDRERIEKSFTIEMPKIKSNFKEWRIAKGLTYLGRRGKSRLYGERLT